MNKRIKIVMMIHIVIGSMFMYNINLSSNNNISSLTIANAEALARGESTTNCPNPYDVPDRYIVSSGPKTATYTTNSSGEINIGGIFYGGYAKNKTITIAVETFNCNGVQQGACCDQSLVGTRPI